MSTTEKRVDTMVEKNSINIKKVKRLPKGQRTHTRRLKQAARKDPTNIVKTNNKRS
jgi:hypothetical protein